MLFRILTFLFMFAASCEPAMAQFSKYEQSLQREKNQLGAVNPGFESGLSRWTASGGTYSSVTSGANLGFGARSASWDASGAQTLTGTQVTLEKALYGKICALSMYYKGGDQNLTLEVINGSSTVLGTVVLGTNAEWGFVEVPFVCPTSSTVAPRISAAADAAIVYIDDVFIGAWSKARETKNYLQANKDAEYGTTSGWKTYIDAAGSTPVDCTGSVSNTAWTTNTTTPLDGFADFKWNKSANNRQGEGVSFGFTVSGADVSKKLAISFDVNATDSNYTANDLAVYVYDVTNSTLITPYVTGIAKAKYTFQTSFDTTTGTSYRVCIHQAGTNATANAVYFDNFQVGPGQLVQGAAISEWQSYTPLTGGVGTPSVNQAWFRRNGSNVDVRGFLDAGTVSANPLKIGLPSVTANASFLAATPNNWLGAGFVSSASGTNIYGVAATAGGLAVIYDASDNTGVFFTSNTATDASGNAIATKQNGSSLMSTGGQLAYYFSVPVNEWAGNGTLNVGPLNGCEYAYTTDTWDGTGSTTAYGPSGQQMAGALSATRNKTVTWQYPVQDTDYVDLEYKDSSTNKWTSMPGIAPYTRQNTVEYGASWFTTSSTQTLVVFFQYIKGGTSFGSAGVNWPSTSSWRVAHCSSPRAVGFGLATSTTTGLVKDIKQYVVGTAYTNGTPSLTGQAGFSNTRSVLIPYQTVDGTWRLRFNFHYSQTSGTNADVTISGVTFNNTTAVSALGATSAAVTFIGRTASSSGVITIRGASADTSWSASGDVELSSKPTWAD